MYKQYSSLAKGKDEDSLILDYWTAQWAALSLESRLDSLKHSELWGILSKHIKPNELILEAGCGLGQWVIFLEKAGHSVVGIDIVLPALVAAKHSFPGANFVQADIRTLPFSKSSFGTHLSFGVMEHFEGGPEAILSEARRLLKPAGVLIATVPFHTPITQLAAAIRQRREGKEHFFQYLFTRREFGDLLNQNGFRVIKIQAFDSPYTMRCLLPGIYKTSDLSWRDFSGLKRLSVMACKITRRVLEKIALSSLCGHMLIAIASPADISTANQ